MITQLKKIKCGKVFEEIDLSKITSYKLKGKAKCLVIPSDLKELIRLIQFVKEHSFSYKIIGGGSNLIFPSYYDGILIQLTHFDQLKISDTKITVGSGYPLIKLALKTARLGLTGLEFATGIPGTVGGAIVNNSGAYNSDMGYVVDKVLVLTPNLEIQTMYNRDLQYHYRTSFFKTNSNYIVLEATIILKHGNKDKIMEIIEDRRQRRILSQPLEFPSAGSVFRNPPNLFSGKLIEDIGYKGKIIGGAQVSEKHANFIINKDHATGEDVMTLIEEIQQKVKEKYQVDLILEQEIVR